MCALLVFCPYVIEVLGYFFSKKYHYTKLGALASQTLPSLIIMDWTYTSRDG